MWTFKVEHKSNREFIEGDIVILRKYPDIKIKAWHPYMGGVMCRVFDEYGEVGYRVFEVSDIINYRYAAFVKHSGSGVEICLN
jgi:hypothetical protein